VRSQIGLEGALEAVALTQGSMLVGARSGRAGYLTCPDSCDSDTEQKDCLCSCKDLDAATSSGAIYNYLSAIMADKDAYSDIKASYTKYAVRELVQVGGGSPSGHD
jgi:hypothetical protein